MINGVGINDYGGNVKINGKFIKSYTTWQGMLMRCYDSKFQEKHPAYIGAIVCEEWLYYSKFKEWYDENYPKHLVDKGIKFELDKDLLSENNKIYSPSTCVFLPKKINLFLANKQANNTSGFIGVYWNKQVNKWKSDIRDFDTGKRKYLGIFTDIKQASQAYIDARAEQSEKAKQYLRELGYNEEIISKIK